MEKRKAGEVCAAKGCKNTRYSCNKSFFRFPADPLRAKRWVNACNREDLLHNLYNLNKGYRLCGVHFDVKMYTNHYCNRLKHNAVPTIFPWLEGSSKGPGPPWDHTYAAKCLVSLDSADQYVVKFYILEEA